MARMTDTATRNASGPGRAVPRNSPAPSACGHRPPSGRAIRVAGASLVGVLLGAGCSTAPGPGGIDKAGGIVASAPVDLRLANTRGFEADPFLRRVAQLSGGALTLTANASLAQPSLTNEPDALRAAQAGQVDIAIVPTRSFDAVGVKTFDALMDPMVVDSLAVQDKVLADPLARDMLDGLAPAGLVGVGVLPGPIRLPGGITRRMLGPATYVGARIATNASPISERALSALGAVPVESAFEGADMSRFDGLEQQAASVAGNRYDGIVRWITTNVGLWPRPVAIVASAGTWGRLTDTQRGWLVQAAKDALSDTTTRTSDLADIASMCRRGKAATVSASTSDISALRVAFAPVDHWLRGDQTTAGYLDRIHTIKKSVGDVPAGQPIDCAALASGPTPTPTRPSMTGSAGPAPTALPAGPATAIDGNHALRTTPQDLAAAGASPGEVVPGNWGDMRWVFDRGRFASTQFTPATSERQVCTWNYGTYAIHEGQVLELTVVDGGGGDVANKPGEVFDYRFSTYRDTMQWSPVAGAASPTPWMAKPWKRQPTQPWTEFLQSQCLPPAGWDG